MAQGVASGLAPVVVVEHTPNPDAIKLLLGRRAAAFSGMEFEEVSAARDVSPLAAELLGIAGLRRVFVGEDFLALTKAPEASWRELAPPALARVSAALARGEPLLRGEQPPATPRGERAELDRAAHALRELAPVVAGHGGQLELVAYHEGVLELRLRGACAGCPSSTGTLRDLVEQRLRDVLPGLRSVIAR